MRKEKSMNYTFNDVYGKSDLPPQDPNFYYNGGCWSVEPDDEGIAHFTPFYDCDYDYDND